MKISGVRARALTQPSADGDGRNEPQPHWIEGRIASPMSIFPEYSERRGDWAAFDDFIVEIEAENGEIGFATSTGGQAAALLVESNLARFVVGRDLSEGEMIWEHLWRSSLHWARKGVGVHAISAVDLALWDLRGKVDRAPVYELLGGSRLELDMYATTPRADAAKALGFSGVKLPLAFGPAQGEFGMKRNVQAIRQARELVGDGFPIMLDCWMALDVPYTVALLDKVADCDVAWIEEPLPPDDYFGYAELRRRLGGGVQVACGEHEAGVQGFDLLMRLGCCDVIQPDVRWCGGLTELLRIAALAEQYGVALAPHCASVYGYHYLATRPPEPLAEFLLLEPGGADVVPILGPSFIGEPLPRDGRLMLGDAPGFGLGQAVDVHATTTTAAGGDDGS